MIIFEKDYQLNHIKNICFPFSSSSSSKKKKKTKQNKTFSIKEISGIFYQSHIYNCFKMYQYFLLKKCINIWIMLEIQTILQKFLQTVDVVSDY